MRRKLRKKPFKRGRRADAMAANIREEENTNPKTPHKVSLLERIKLKGNLKTVLADKLEPDQQKQLYKSYDIVGDIAVVRIPQPLEQHSKLIAQTIMDTHREVKSVWQQVSSVSGDFRLRTLKHLLGEKTTQTTYKEHGCTYKTDLRQAYFSPRLSYERLRIAKLVQKGETVLNMFAGVGCFSISCAKHAEPLKVISVDVNPTAYKYLQQNIRINRVEKTVVALQGDAKTLTKNKLQHVADRILIPLPELAYDYLEVALWALKPVGGWIHYYDFEYAKKNKDPVKKTEQKVSEKLEKLCSSFQVEFGRIVRPIGPNWYQVVLDIHT